MTQQHIYSLKDVAALVGVKPHRIEYALRNGYLPEPAERVTNRRIFSRQRPASGDGVFL